MRECLISYTDNKLTNPMSAITEHIIRLVVVDIKGMLMV